MEKTVRFLVMLCLAVAAIVPHAAWAQGMPPPPPPGFGGPGARMPMRDWTPEQREQWREERRQRREAWMQMSPEERHQLRRDIRDAGQQLYPPGRHRGRD